ncbi:phage tail protein [Escherichia coli]|uniref:head-tail joining protein n=1 Tax=Escherichia coli TaxID=562 RepID=UPI000BE17373|nr:head-tail joining protein [Escherichia coli]EJE8507767.1 phage tail protein [Shigella sonnei]EEQ3300463.1 phage tail protein [Escherichia coli]EES9725079.1 phage tail protein [Escherichia coli]EFI8247983.1 phage tail protein [Escherichia coli]EFR0609113.1 phage tail protein [Escherichia coli]
MADFDNPFDAALDFADRIIIRDMGCAVIITSGQLKGCTISGVFDDPENISFAAGGVRIEDSEPSLFVKTADIALLCRNDLLMIGQSSFRVERITPDDGGCSYIRLRREVSPGKIRGGRYYEGA